MSTGADIEIFVREAETYSGNHSEQGGLKNNFFCLGTDWKKVFHDKW